MSSDAWHRLLVLGSMDEFVPLVSKAHERGIYVVVCDGYENGPAKQVADARYDVDIRDYDAVADVSTSICEPFTISLANLPASTYQIQIDLSGDGKTGMITDEMEVK